MNMKRLPSRDATFQAADWSRPWFDVTALSFDWSRKYVAYLGCFNLNDRVRISVLVPRVAPRPLANWLRPFWLQNFHRGYPANLRSDALGIPNSSGSLRKWPNCPEFRIKHKRFPICKICRRQMHARPTVYTLCSLSPDRHGFKNISQIFPLSPNRVTKKLFLSKSGQHNFPFMSVIQFLTLI